jgi:hypothetical protein
MAGFKVPRYKATREAEKINLGGISTKILFSSFGDISDLPTFQVSKLLDSPTTGCFALTLSMEIRLNEDLQKAKRVTLICLDFV